MNKSFIISMILILFVVQTQAQIFVKHDANGANDGTTWENAYIELQTAIASSTINDQIWVSSGTYNPGETPTDFFSLPHDLEIYGGFDGTETMLAERDWVNNETILSGDHNGDDINNVFNENKSDNSHHVMWLTDVITSATIIDGVSIKYGNTLADDGTGDERRGGGILSYGSPTIRNCAFEQNFGQLGGGFYPRDSASINFTLDNCSFKDNTSFNGGGVYNLSGLGVFTDCTFENNEATNRGGAVFNASSGISFTNCAFSNNQAFEDAGAIFINNVRENPEPINLLNCEFITNNCSDWSGAMAIFGSFTTANITDCTFLANTCSGNGGAMVLGFQSTTNLDNCLFELNSASTGRGGAIYVLSQNTKLNADKCTYLFNSAEVGGAISNSGTITSVDSIPLIQLNLNDSYFQFNTSILQGGAINAINSECNFTNTVIESNFVIDDEGAGGGIIFNTVDSINGAYSLINCTIGNNEAALGAGIASYKEGDVGSFVLTLQNTILHNPIGLNYQIEFGDPEVISNGGNLSSDFTLNPILINTNDLLEIDPLFIDADNNNFRLQDDSPCVNSGVSIGAPLLDIEGNERVNEIDMGAYENQQLVGVSSAIQIFGSINIYPNPVEKQLNFSFEDVINTTLKIKIIDSKGQIISTQYLDKRNEVINHIFDVESLASGIYYLNISDENRINVKPFYKR